ncbi:tetratricopeptide repeat protein [bacterium BMS3Abin03]|nr:tetratricopeptide repeat protein [bacterium BMS3Abin03]
MKAAKTSHRLPRHSILSKNIETSDVRQELAEGNFEEAIKSLSDVIESSPLNANAYFMRATLKVRIGDIEGARSDFKMSEACHRSTDFKFPEYPVV